jgi:hypothetical protein
MAGKSKTALVQPIPDYQVLFILLTLLSAQLAICFSASRYSIAVVEWRSGLRLRMEALYRRIGWNGSGIAGTGAAFSRLFTTRANYGFPAPPNFLTEQRTANWAAKTSRGSCCPEVSNQAVARRRGTTLHALADE